MHRETCISSQPNNLIKPIILQVFPPKVRDIQLQSNQIQNHLHAALLRLLIRGNAVGSTEIENVGTDFPFYCIFIKFAHFCYTFICGKICL